MTTDEAGGQAAQIAPKRSLGRILLSVPEVGVLGAVIVAFVVFYIADKSIAAPKTLQIMAQQGTFIGLAAFGMIFLMIAGEIDLSSGAVAGLAAVIAGMLIALAGWSQMPAYLAGILTALLVGSINAFVTLRIGMPSFFATLAMSFTITGLLIWLLNGTFIYMEKSIPFLEKVSHVGPAEGYPWVFIFYLGAVIVGDIAMRTTRLGPILTAVGGNRRAAEIVGIHGQAGQGALLSVREPLLADGRAGRHGLRKYNLSQRSARAGCCG